MSKHVMRSARFKRLVLNIAEGLGSDVKSYRDFEVEFPRFA